VTVYLGKKDFPREGRGKKKRICFFPGKKISQEKGKKPGKLFLQGKDAHRVPSKKGKNVKLMGERKKIHILTKAFERKRPRKIWVFLCNEKTFLGEGGPSYKKGRGRSNQRKPIRKKSDDLKETAIAGEKREEI